MEISRRRFMLASVSAMGIVAGAGYVSIEGRRDASSDASRAHTLILGRSAIKIPRGGVVGAQIDRVLRDIVWKDSRFDARHASVLKVPKIDEIVPYMEGRLSRELVRYADTKIIGLTPAISRQKDDLYYADNGKGEYAFLIDPSKTEYPTAGLSRDGDYGVFIDTHGFNMVAGAAIRQHAIAPICAVIACMDTPAKADAALYLAQHGVNCYGPCDSFAQRLFGYRATSSATIMGTAPIRADSTGAIIGAQEVLIDLREKIVVERAREGDLPYCGTPHRYFEALAGYYEVDLDLHSVIAGVGEAGKVTEAAQDMGAHVIGVRVYNEADAVPVIRWLEGDHARRAILFHSAQYEAGYPLFFRFPEQTSFGDLEPVFS